MKNLVLKFSLLSLLLGLPACERPAVAPSAAAIPVTREVITPLVTKKLLQEPIEPTLFELPSMAVTAWRQTGNKPALLLLANDPFLAAIPDALAEQALTLTVGGTIEELRDFASYRRPAPRLLPFQTLRAALRGGLFSRLVWVFPTSKEGVTPDLENFRSQLLERELLSRDETDGLRLEQGVFRGEIHGIPFQAGPLSAGQLPAEPSQLHLDLSYFTPLYKDEVRTPVFEILRETAATLAAADLPSVGVSLSYSTAEGLLPLDLRFLIANFASLVQHPERLQAPLASPWKERGAALYLATFMQTENVLAKNLEALTAAPDDPAVHFDLYRTYRASKNGQKALDHLAQAVALDRGYAMEYLNLASTALEQKLPREAVEMVNLAAAALPEDFFIPLQKAELLLELGDKAAARPLIKSLQGLPWSPIYFPELPGRLQQQSDQAAE